MVSFSDLLVETRKMHFKKLPLLCTCCVYPRMLWAKDDMSCWYQDRGGVMREILTEDGHKCQSQEQGTSCWFHAAEVAKRGQMVAKQVTFWCLLCPLGSCLIYCQEFLPQLWNSYFQKQNHGKRSETFASVGILLLWNQIVAHDILIDNRTQ